MDYIIEKTEDKSRWEALLATLPYDKDPQYIEECLWRQSEGQVDLFILAVNDSTKEAPRWQDTGYVVLNRFPKYGLYARLGIFEVQDLNIAPDFRQRGLATMLIRHCEGIARAEKCKDIGISVGLTPEYGSAQRLYAKLGYLPDGQGVTYDRRPLKHGARVTLDDDLCLMMIKAL